MAVDPATVTAAAGAATQIAGFFLDAFQPSGPASGQVFKLPKELETQFFEMFDKTIREYDQTIAKNRELIPVLEQRVNAIYEASRAATPSAEQIQRINQIDAEIAERFGRQTLADIQAGVITQEARNQTEELQKLIRSQIEAEGKVVDGTTDAAIRQRIREGLASGRNTNDIEQGILSDLKSSVDVFRQQDPGLERQIKQQETALRQRLRQQFGPDYENTTQGRRALEDFFQGATETRFQVGRQIREEQDLARQRGIERLTGLGTAIGTASNEGLRATIALRESQRADADVALRAGQNLRSAFNEGIRNQGTAVTLAQIPFQLRERTAQLAGENLKNFQTAGSFEFSGQTSAYDKARREQVRKLGQIANPVASQFKIFSDYIPGAKPIVKTLGSTVGKVPGVGKYARKLF